MPAHHRTNLPPELVRAALALLISGAASDRRRAAQLLARGYALDEEARLDGIHEVHRSDGYEEAHDYPALAEEG